MDARPKTGAVSIVFALLLTFFLCYFDMSLAATDDDALIAMGLCKDMEYYINSIVDYTETKCIPSLDQKGNSFIFVSSKPVFAVEASKKAWILVVAAAVGHDFNQRPKYALGSIYVSDINMLQSHKYFSFSGALAKSLQAKTFTGEIHVEAMWQKISTSMQEVEVK